jgi:hypothetical protein
LLSYCGFENNKNIIISDSFLDERSFGFIDSEHTQFVNNSNFLFENNIIGNITFEFVKKNN